MKTALSLLIVGVGITSTLAQDVFVLGGPGTTPIPPIVYAPPVVMTAPTIPYPSVQPVLAVIPVTPVYSTPLYAEPAPCYSSYSYSTPNVIYIGGPGPAYYDHPRCSTPNVIYFGGTQAYREGYHFSRYR